MSPGKKSTGLLRRRRRGAIVALVAVSLPVLVLLAAIAVNVAYMELARAELRIACDSAAKAALVRLGATQVQSDARTFARSVSDNNLVAGQNLVLSDANIEFGNSAKNGSGVYVFSQGVTPLNSVRVTGTVNPQLMMGKLLPFASFSTTQVSVARRISHDIVLVLDRSASMSFDLSASTFVYPADRTALGSVLQCYFLPPSPTASRWKALTDAVNSFVTVLSARNLDAKVALVTYSEAFTFGNYNVAQATLDVQLTSTYSQITTAMNVWGSKPLLGDTNIEAGLAMAKTEITGTRSRTVADRTIILLTDGAATSGNLNIASLVQSSRQTSQIVTHVITFGGQAASGTIQATMQSAAQQGNGSFYNAATAAQLQQAFQDIADSLPAVLTD